MVKPGKKTNNEGLKWLTKGKTDIKEEKKYVQCQKKDGNMRSKSYH